MAINLQDFPRMVQSDYNNYIAEGNRSIAARSSSSYTISKRPDDVVVGAKKFGSELYANSQNMWPEIRLNGPVTADSYSKVWPEIEAKGLELDTDQEWHDCAKEDAGAEWPNIEAADGIRKTEAIPPELWPEIEVKSRVPYSDAVTDTPVVTNSDGDTSFWEMTGMPNHTDATNELFEKTSSDGLSKTSIFSTGSDIEAKTPDNPGLISDGLSKTSIFSTGSDIEAKTPENPGLITSSPGHGVKNVGLSASYTIPESPELGRKTPEKSDAILKKRGQGVDNVGLFECDNIFEMQVAGAQMPENESSNTGFREPETNAEGEKKVIRFELNKYMLMLEDILFTVLQRCNKGVAAPFDRLRDMNFSDAYEAKRKRQITRVEIFTSRALRRLCKILDVAGRHYIEDCKPLFGEISHAVTDRAIRKAYYLRGGTKLWSSDRDILSVPESITEKHEHAPSGTNDGTAVSKPEITQSFSKPRVSWSLSQPDRSGVSKSAISKPKIAFLRKAESEAHVNRIRKAATARRDAKLQKEKGSIVEKRKKVKQSVYEGPLCVVSSTIPSAKPRNLVSDEGTRCLTSRSAAAKSATVLSTTPVPQFATKIPKPPSKAKIVKEAAAEDGGKNVMKTKIPIREETKPCKGTSVKPVKPYGLAEESYIRWLLSKTFGSQ